MVNGKIKYDLIFILLLITQLSLAQGHLFSRIKTDENLVFIGEPVEVKVSVFTSTWFTKGVDPGNVKVEGAFTLFFRSVNSTERINGKTYAGVEMIFNVFPYEEKDIIFPSLEINVESPDEGTSKGVARVIKTESRKIVVKPVPPNIDRKSWIVASYVTVSQKWNGNLKQVKVGDVLERKISRVIQGQVAELIPPVDWDTVPGVSNYAVRGELVNNKSKTDISASRTDGVKYLFEKEGEIVIPEYVVTWWNPQLKKLQKYTVKETVVNVLPNSNLGMLASIRDSLQEISAETSETADIKKEFSFLGMNWKQLVLALLVLILMIYVLVKVILKLKKVIVIRKENYRKSELFYFRKFEKANLQNNSSLSLPALYRWIDQLNLPEPTITFLINNYGTAEMILKNKATGKKEVNTILNKKEWRAVRLNVIHKSAGFANRNELNINP